MNLKNINQKILIQTSLFGVFMGISTVLGWSQNSQVFLWAFTGILTSIYLYNNLTHHFFFHCLIIGLSWGVDCSLVQVLFFKTYYLNNSHFVNELHNISSSSPRITLVALGMSAGLVSGFLIYIPIYILKKIKK